MSWHWEQIDADGNYDWVEVPDAPPDDTTDNSTVFPPALTQDDYYTMRNEAYRQLPIADLTAVAKLDPTVVDSIISRWMTGTGADRTVNWSAVGSDLKTLAAGGAAVRAFQQASNPPLTGYQGGISKFTATREAVPTAQTARPGVGGQRYLTDTAFSLPATATTASGLPAAQAATTAQATTLAAQNQAAVPNVTQNMPDPAVVKAQQDQFFGRTPVAAAQGGLMGLAKGGQPHAPRYLQGNTDGMADKIPARIDGQQEAALAHGEFVVPADVVSHLGNGNSDAGADVLYKMMDKIRKARTGTKKQGKQIDPNKFTPGGLAYAAGGVIGFPTGGEVPSGVVGTESNLSNWVGPYVTDMLGKGQALSAQPYQAYQGPLSAGDSSLQTQAYGLAGGLQTPTSIGQAADTAGTAATAMGNLSYSPTSTTNQFTAPTNTGYTAQNVGTTTAGPAQQATSTGYNATNAGAFGATAANAGTAQQAIGTGYDAASSGAIGATAANAGTAQQAGSQGYNAATMGAFGVNAAQTGYNPAAGLQNYQMGPATDITSQQFTSPGVASAYMNPYLQQSLDPQLAEARRQSQISQQATNAQATQAGAFGGSRSAILGAENQRNLGSNLANITGQGYNTAYTTGQNQFNADQGRSLTAQQANQAAGMNVGSQNLQARLGVQALGAQYGSQMALANLSNQQQANLQSSAQAQQAAQANQNAYNQAGQFGASAANQAALANQQAYNQMSQYNAGLGQAANLQTSAQAQQAALANQNAYNQSRQYGATATNQANLANQQAYNQMAQYNAGLGQAANLQTSAQAQQAALANAGYGNQASQFGAAAGNQANLANQQAYNQMAQYNAGLGQTGNLANQQAYNQAAQFGAQQGMTSAQLAAQYGLSSDQLNQSGAQFGAQYGLQALQGQVSAANTQGQLGALQNQTGLANLNELAGLGATQQATEQAGIAADQAAFNAERDNPYKMVQYQQSLLQGLPLAAQQYNTTTNPYAAAAGALTGTNTLLGG